MGVACVHRCPFCIKRAFVQRVLLPHSYPDLYGIPEEAKQVHKIVSIYDVLERAVEITGNRAAAVDALLAGTLLSPEICAKVCQERNFAEHADDFLDHLVISPAQASKIALAQISKQEKQGSTSSLDRKLHEQPVVSQIPKHTHVSHDIVNPGEFPRGAVENNADKSKLKEVFGESAHGLLRFGTPPTELTSIAQKSVDFAAQLNQTSSADLDALLGKFPTGNGISCAIISRLAYLIPFTTCDEHLLDLFGKEAKNSFVDVPAPVFFRTGVFSRGQDIIAPALHSELLFELATDCETSPIQVKWLLQMSSNGKVMCEFAPIGTARQASFVGTKRRIVSSGVGCVSVLKLCIELGPAMKKFAANSGWAVGGFFRFGVCNDSVELVLRAAFGKGGHVWPLLNMPQALQQFADHVDEVFSDTKLDSQQIERLKDALRSMPSDGAGLHDPDTAERIMASWPWSHGQEPFSSATAAYSALVKELEMSKRSKMIHVLSKSTE